MKDINTPPEALEKNPVANQAASRRLRGKRCAAGYRRAGQPDGTGY